MPRGKVVNEDTDIDLEARLNKALTKFSTEAYKRPNPMASNMRDFRILCIVFNCILPVVKIIFGIIYRHDCPTNKYIPVLMWGGGFTEILFMITIVLKKVRICRFLNVVAGAVMIIWIVVEMLNVFVAWGPDYHITGWRYCHVTIFQFYLVVTLLEVAIMALVVFYLCINFSFI